jgi:membrane protein required for colicin V production
MAIDLAAIALIVLAALSGAATGALRQLVSLVAVVLGVLAARVWADDVGAGLAREITPVARHLAPLLLFLGIFALASLVGRALLGATGMARIVRGPADRGVGALLGGAKGALAAWALLSVLVLAGNHAPDAVVRRARGSDFAALAREHNLVRTLDPAAARALERAIDTARRVERAGKLARDPESARLLGDPRIRALEDGGHGAPLDLAAAARVMEDPQLRALVERLAGRAPSAQAAAPTSPAAAPAPPAAAPAPQKTAPHPKKARPKKRASTRPKTEAPASSN